MLNRTISILTKAQKIYIAYSGGIDSHVLLHLCASFEHIKDKITAVYIDHGLQAESGFWGKHCEQICENLRVKFLNLCVNASAKHGESPEEAARNARYDAFKVLLDQGDLLLVAQHAEDQLETVLLQLFRGSGLKGLSGMPEIISFGKGKLIRPLLDVPKTAIIDYAKKNGLKWIEDPSNQQVHFDRNFLRNDIIPLLKQRWPVLDKTVSRSAQHIADAQTMLDSVTDKLFWTILDKQDNALQLQILLQYPLLQQRLIIRQWFRLLGLKMPSKTITQQILQQVACAREAAEPKLSIQGMVIRRYRDKLFCLKDSILNVADNLVWPPNEQLLKLSDDRIYEVIISDTGIPVELWRKAMIRVKFRVGGETIAIKGRRGHHTLKKLYQEAGISPWEREKTPQIYLDNKLAAIGEYWINAEFFSQKKESCFRIIRRNINLNSKGNDDAADVD